MVSLDMAAHCPEALVSVVLLTRVYSHRSDNPRTRVHSHRCDKPRKRVYSHRCDNLKCRLLVFAVYKVEVQKGMSLVVVLWVMTPCILVHTTYISK